MTPPKDDTSRLKGCPFCPNGGNPAIQAHGFGNFSGLCHDCGSQNAQTRGIEAAVRVWNTRAATVKLENAESALRGQYEVTDRLHREIAELKVKGEKMVRALEEARKTLESASRMLSDQHRVILQGREWGGKTLQVIEDALAAYEKNKSTASRGQEMANGSLGDLDSSCGRKKDE